MGLLPFGTFSSYLAAYSLGIPIVIHEANAEPGLANRIASHVADLACLAFESAAARIRPPVRVTGIPTTGIEPSAPPADAPPRFLVLGGSEGSPALNRDAAPMFAELRRAGLAFSVTHICGFGDRDAIARAYRAACVEADVLSFVGDMAAVYRGASFAISSAGARTLAELSAAAIPSLLVPLRGAANDHQSANAREYAAHTGALVAGAAEWDPIAIAARLRTIVAGRATLRDMRQRAGRWANAGCAGQIVHACERLLEEDTSAAPRSVTEKLTHTSFTY